MFEYIAADHDLKRGDTMVLVDHGLVTLRTNMKKSPNIPTLCSMQVGSIISVESTAFADRVASTSVVHPPSLIWDHLTRGGSNQQQPYGSV